MKQIVLTAVVILTFGLATLAQTSSPSDPQSSSPSSPSSQQGSNPSATSPSSSSQQNPDTGSASAGAQSSASDRGEKTKAEKKLKGCIESQGSNQYVLREKGGKEVALTGTQDFASHVGHSVTLHGSFEASSAGAAASSSGSEKLPSSSGSATESNPSASASGGMSSSPVAGKQFMVTKIDHESDTCKLDKSNPSATKPSSSPNQQ